VNVSPTILLIGLRGSGKSTVGRALAAIFGRPFADLDELTPRLLGCETVREAWERFGEQEFRRAESEALENFLQNGGSGVLALGGGTPTAPGAREEIERAQRSGRVRVVYLREAPSVLRERLSRSGPGPDRPSLTGGDPLDEIEAVFAARDGVYVALADFTVSGAGDVRQTAQSIAQLIGKGGG